MLFWALLSRDAERPDVRSHAERGNEESWSAYFFCPFAPLSLPAFSGA